MPKRNLAWIVIIAMIALLMWQLPQTIAGRDSVLKAFGALVDARAQIRKRYVNDVNDDALINAAVDSGIRAMVRGLDDPHAVYLNEQQYARFRQQTDGLYGGIGVQVWSTEAGLEVLSREPNSPAVDAGILPGEIITHIDGKPTADVPLIEAVNDLLNGPQDTEVSLTVLTPAGMELPEGRNPGRLGKTREVTLYRAIIKVDPLEGWSRGAKGDWRFMLDPELGIGYIRLIKFSPDIDERLDEEINRLQRQNLQGLILDLRENPGGLLDSAREVADKFLEGGLIVRTAGRRTDEKQWFAMREGTYPHFPMAVLINGSTASAAEIVAGALGDHKRAVVIGERSYGKGSVQEVVELEDHGGAIKLTTAYYYLPSGRCIQRTLKSIQDGTWGVMPNLLVNLSADQHAKSLAAWRKIHRESLPHDERVGSDEHAANTSVPAEQSPMQDEATRLLEADPQLNKAVEYVHDRIRPSGKPSRSRQGDSRSRDDQLSASQVGVGSANPRPSSRSTAGRFP
jgi:carboxyl-terminal processing protease